MNSLQQRKVGDQDANKEYRNYFYPNFQMIANDLHEKGLLPAGEYSIDIDW